MKLFQKALLSVAGLGLVAAAAFPYAKAYLDSQPKHLTVEEAGKIYLKAVCPANKYKNYLDSLQKKHDHEMSITYYDEQSLAYANHRVAALELRQKLALEGYAKAEIQLSKTLNNPKTIWPDSVKKEVKEFSTYSFTDGGLLLDENFKDAEKLNDKNLASKIRQELNLPTVNKGCEDVK
jgi:hypothetical protein